MRSATVVGSNTAVITTATSLAVSSTATQLGVSNIQANPPNGRYTIAVTQSTGGAVQASAIALAASTVIDGTNNGLSVVIDGASRSLTIPAGTYTPVALAAAVQAALSTVGGGASVAVDGSGRLTMSTTHEGSAATLEIAGGTAMSALQLAVGSSTGTDGTVRIGSNPPVTVTSAGTGASVVVSTGTGSLTLNLGGALRVGTADVAVVSTGDRSLTSVAAAINGANIGASAAAVKVADGSWLLQINSTKSGAANSLALDSAAFSGVGGLIQTASGQDAKITIGTGPGAYSVLSSTNAFTDVLPGVTVNANAISAAPVTVTVGRDSGASADLVGNLVSAATSLLADIAMQTSYNAKTKTSSPLSGDATIRQMANQIRSAVTSLVGNVSLPMAGSAGISLKQDGSLAFDRSKFIAALEADPAGVARLFSRGGTSAGGASWAAASDKTVAGSYGVVVTAAPTRATTGDMLIGGSVAGQTIGVTFGTTTATYRALPGASADDIATGLNAALAQAGLKINAEVSGGGVRLTSVAYGAAASFQTDLDVGGPGSAPTSNVGADVVGTIDGHIAVGVGNRLSLLDGDTSLARGLGVDVAEGVTGTIGPIEYQPGVAARIAALATALTGTTGRLTTAATAYEARSKAFNDQITRFELRMTIKETQYRRQWTAVQTSLSNLQNQGSWLASQINGLPNSSNS
jgi:flagellar hook-associated protein 2